VRRRRWWAGHWWPAVGGGVVVLSLKNGGFGILVCLSGDWNRKKWKERNRNMCFGFVYFCIMFFLFYFRKQLGLDWCGTCHSRPSPGPPLERIFNNKATSMSHLLNKVKYLSMWWLKKNDVNVSIMLFGCWQSPLDCLGAG